MVEEQNTRQHSILHYQFAYGSYIFGAAQVDETALKCTQNMEIVCLHNMEYTICSGIQIHLMS